MKIVLISAFLFVVSFSIAVAEGVINCTFYQEGTKKDELVILGDRGLLHIEDPSSQEKTTSVFHCNDTHHTYTCINFWTNPSNNAVIHYMLAVTKDFKTIVVSRSGPNAPDKAFVSIFSAECRQN